MSLKQKCHLLLELLILFSLSNFDSVSADCEIFYLWHIKKHSPIYTISKDNGKSFDLFKISDFFTCVPSDTQLFLICPPSPSSRDVASRMLVTCRKYEECSQSLDGFIDRDYGFYDRDNVSVNLREHTCGTVPSSSLKQTSESCSNGQGYIFNVGVEIGIQKQNFSPLFSICYDSTNQRTLYTHNIINVGYIYDDTTRRFNSTGMKMSTGQIDTAYSKDNQKEVFENLFGKKQSYYKDQKYFLAKVHLSPKDDFLFAYEQMATYYYVNAAPMWQIINAGNWRRVKNIARQFAIKFDDDLDIYNGYLGELELPHLSRTHQRLKISLDPNNIIKVPEYFFKVIKYQATDSAIVMITLNNPYIPQGIEVKFCTDVCGEANLDHPDFSDKSKGTTFCCTLSDFKNHYSNLPSTLSAANLLKKKIKSN